MSHPDGRAIELGSAPGLPIAARIAVRNGPISGIVASPDGTRLMVANYGRDSVSVIDTGTRRVVRTVAGLNEPFAIAMGRHDTRRAYVSTVSPAYDSIGVIDVPSNAVIATHPVALSVSDLAVSPDGQRVYASRNGAGGPDVAVLDTRTGRVEAIALPGTTTQCVRVSPDGDRVYVATNGPAGGRLVVIGGDTRRVIGAVEIDLPIRDVALGPNDTIAYVASCAPERGAVVDVVDTRTAAITGTRTIAEADAPTGLTLSGDGDRAYLVGGDGITVLCTLTHDVVGTLAVASRPSCVTESPDGEYLYVADHSGTVTVARVASIVAPGAETAVDERDAATEWVVPELLCSEPVPA
ncbi:YncE family protein [Mycobacterium heidelbergense]|uniref:YncE family protein n=1 Tax=Mycobacterium heidelbergense TaxID=53376 RepID=UPI0022B2AA95|nr:YncE family protein [Mycobacterium heidelbergense]